MIEPSGQESPERIGGHVEVVSPVTPLPYTITALGFYGERHGWAMTDAGVILGTRDGGASWQKQNRNSDHVLRGTCFLNGSVGWAVGGRQAQGLTYEIEMEGVIHRCHPWGTGVLLHTEDAGLIWHERGLPCGEFEFNDVFFADALHGWIVGDCGYARRTTDGGRTWEALPEIRFTDLVACHFFDERCGVVVGTSWNVDADHLGDAWNSGPSAEYAGDEHAGLILRTSDGGDSWVLAHSQEDCELTGMTFVDHETGWAVGENGLILLTEDGGESWRAQVAQTGAKLRAVSFADRRHGWVAGGAGTLLRTHDGGVTWGVAADVGAHDLTSVVAVDESLCFAGSGGSLLRIGSRADSPMPDKADDVIIRQANKLDIHDIRKMFLDSGIPQDLVCMPYPFEDRWSTSLRPEFSGSRIADVPGSYGLVAELGGVIVGYLGMATDTAFRRRGVMEIGLGVAKSVRRRQVGSALLRQALEIADDWLPVMRIEALLYDDCVAGETLLRQNGFRSEGVLESYVYRERELANVRLMSRTS